MSRASTPPAPARTAAPSPAPAEAWVASNEAFNLLAVERIRVLLKRHIDHLRPGWAVDPLHHHGPSVVSDEQADWLLTRRPNGVARARDHAHTHNGSRPGDDGALELVERRMEDLRARMAEAGTPPALDILAARLALDRFEQDVLTLCLAPEIEPDYSRLYAYAQDDSARTHPTPHLASALFGGGAGSWDRLLPLAPLRYHGLVEASQDNPSAPIAARPLRITTRALAFLRGAEHPDEVIARALRPLHAAPLTPPLEELAGRLATFLAAQHPPWPVLNLQGPPGTGRRALAHALCAALGLHLAVLDPARLPATPAEREDALRRLRRETVLTRTVAYIEAPAQAGGDPPDGSAGAIDVVEVLPGFLVVASRASWRCDRAVLPVRMPPMDAMGQESLWRQALGLDPHTPDDGVGAAVGALAQQFSLSPSDVPRAIQAARQHARLQDPDGTQAVGDGRVALPAEALWHAARVLTAGGLDRLTQRIVPVHEWDDIVLPEDAEAALREIADQIARRHRVYETWGFGKRLNRGRGISILFAGPSGTGKTLAAEVLARHLDLDLHRINLANTVSKYIGETEKNLQGVFDAAESSGAVLFFDEADALFGKRTEVKDSHDRYANLEVDYLLQRMEDYRGLAILATNRKSDLDEAFLRRLRFIVDFPRPGPVERLRIWRRAFPPDTPLDSVDLQALSRLDVTGGNIRNIALNAAFLAAGGDGPVTMDHIMHAARREYAKIEKRATELEFGRYYRVGGGRGP